MNWNNLELPANPYYQDKYVTIYHGDCRDILSQLPKVDLVLTDPPYGIDVSNMQLGSGIHNFYRGDWDNQRPVDVIRQILAMQCKFILWGGNYFADVLPPSNDWLVWHKLNDGLSFSEAELAWSNLGKNVRVFSKYVANLQKVHPTQKPVDVFQWCILQAGENIDLILDPFLGSGTTAYCAKKLNRKCIGIEIEEKYCEIAAKRCCQEVMELNV